MTSALIGLAGALIGALAAIGAQWLGIRHTQQADRRREAIELATRMWDAADRSWRAANGLEHAIIGLDNAKPQGGPVYQLYADRRTDSMEKQHAAEVEGRLIAAQMRLLYPQLAGPATDLLEASLTYENDKRDEQRATRSAALEAFEFAARQSAR